MNLPSPRKYLTKWLQIMNPFSSSLARNKIMCDNNEAGPFNTEMIQHAEQEFNNPVKYLLGETAKDIEDLVKLPFRLAARTFNCLLGRPIEILTDEKDSKLKRIISGVRDDIRDLVTLPTDILARTSSAVISRPIEASAETFNRGRYILDATLRQPPRFALIAADYSSAAYSKISKLHGVTHKFIREKIDGTRNAINKGVDTILGAIPFLDPPSVKT